jgi:polar amino acid transport system permease protein
MSVCYGAYMGEIFRAGISSIPKGQMEAALALGMTRRQALRKVILPQTVRIILPPVGNEFIALLKDSSLVSILAVSDLLRRGREFASTSFEYFETYTVVALVYLVLTLFFSKLVGVMEDRLGRSGT